MWTGVESLDTQPLETGDSIRGQHQRIGAPPLNLRVTVRPPPLSSLLPLWASFVTSTRSAVSFPQDVDTDRAASLDCQMTTEL